MGRGETVTTGAGGYATAAGPTTSMRVTSNSLPLATSHAVAGAPTYCCSVQNGTLVELTNTVVKSAAAIVFKPVGPLSTTVPLWQSTDWMVP